MLTSKATRQADPDANPAIIGINNPTNAVFEITDFKLYVPVDNNENKLLEQLKTGCPLTVEWNKYRCQISNQTANNN